MAGHSGVDWYTVTFICDIIGEQSKEGENKKMKKLLDIRENINEQKLLRQMFLMLGDILLVNAAQFMALFLRFEFSYTEMMASGFLHNLTRFAPIYTVMCLIIFYACGLYNSLWVHVSEKEAMRIVQAAFAVCLLQYVGLMQLQLDVPRSFPTLNVLVLGTFLMMERFSYRFLRVFRIGFRYRRSRDKRARTLLIGAGVGGAMVLQEMNTSNMSHNNIVCIIDGDSQKWGMNLHGVPIYGDRTRIAEAVKRFDIEEIIFAIPSCSNEERRKILKLCQETGCVTKTLPGLTEIANGEIQIQKLRNVNIEDLLGRDCVQVNMEEIGRYIEGKRVLVTGGGGSIGSELCRQIAARNPAQLIIFDIYENNAYNIQQELRRKYPQLHLSVLIGSVRDEARVEQIFERYRPQVVYHAAAHKHVPLMEDSPNEAVKNNVFGTYNVAAVAERHEVETFVLISSDKAVNPTNVMGATKRICEMIIQMFNRKSQHTKFVAVRFGNVLGSNGSVIPLFRRQIEEGGPVTVTHKDIIRYFMTIPEAVSLVMQAGGYAKGGEIFVLDMGEPVRIDDLARNMIRLSGLEPDVDIQVVYTGLRPGEKLFEELLMSEEGLGKTANDLIFIGRPSPFDDENLMQSLERLNKLSGKNSEGIVDEIAALVTTYHREPEHA